MPDDEEEGSWEYYRDYLLDRIKQTKNFSIWIRAGVFPWVDPKTLTREQVSRLQKEYGRYLAQKYQQERISQIHSEWLTQYQVPEAGQEEYSSYPIKYNPRLLSTGRYYPPTSFMKGRIELGPAGGLKTSTLAHEIAHAHYFEQLPISMREEVGKILDWLEKTSPEFRQTMYKATGGRKKYEEWSRRPQERHAVLYQVFGKHPETIPFYLDKYFGNLKPWKIESNLGLKRWLSEQGQIKPEEFYKQPWE